MWDALNPEENREGGEREREEWEESEERIKMEIILGAVAVSSWQCSPVSAYALKSSGIRSWSFGRPFPASSPILSSSSSSAMGTHLHIASPSPKTFLTTISRPAFLHDHSAAASSADVEATGVAAEADPSLLVKKKAAEVAPVLKGTSIFLVGMNSSIKSNLGKVLADALRYYYFDSDNLVEEAAGGKSTVRLLIDKDEEGFRESETEVLKQLSSMGRLIVCAGNGAVQSAANLALLRHGISIWIDVPLDVIVREVLEHDLQIPASESTISGSYPEVLTELTRLYEKCQSGYAAADSTVSLLKVASKLGYEDLAEVTVEDMALEVLRELEKLTRVKKMMEAAAKPF